MRWTKKHTADLEKELHYPLSLTKFPVLVKYPDGEERRYFPPHRVEVSANFFRSVKCVVCCRCCSAIAFSKFWTEREFKVLEEMYPAKISDAEWSEVEVELDGRPVKFMAILETSKKGCPFLVMEEGCQIHEWNPVHCRLPLVKFKNRNGVTRITKEKYGRNWAMKCQMEFAPLTREEFERWDLEVMGRVLGLAEDLGASTRVEWVIRELKRRFVEPARHESILQL